MKSLYLSFVSLALLLFSFTGLSQSSEEVLQQQFLQKSKQPVALPAGVSDNWYEGAVKNIGEREYYVKDLGSGDRFGAFNRQQQLAFQFTPTGYDIKRVDIAHDLDVGWEVGFQLEGIGRNNQPQLLPETPHPDHALGQVRYHYNGFSVEYINNNAGMRQNFIVQERPSGTGNLKAWMHIQSSLQATIENNRLLLHKKGNNKDIELIYDGLKAWDADHKQLPASLQLERNGSLAIVVDDSHATYPITIDPLNHTPDWTDNGQGLVFPLLDDLASHLLYGFSVSGAGDVNNDTFDDIIIGAPAYVNIISISGGTFSAVSVGAAFIYYGSGSGPSLTPTEALQPVSLAGALFGFSVSKAGDINNDGFDDVVIGAPGDHVDLTVGLGTVNAAVGKVYIYYGNTFDGSVNTEPVVSVTLNLTQVDFGVLALTPANPLYGFSVSDAGDVNGDGFADIVVGSPAYTNLVPLTLGGRVDVYTGSLAGLNPAPHKIVGGIVGGLFGYSVSKAGKINNDAFDDIIAGAPASIGIVSVGTAYIFHGSGTGITANNVAGANTTLQAPGILSQTLFGYSVSNAGDVNGDGREDVIIGEPLSLEQTLSLQLVAVGRAHIYYGANAGLQTSGSTILTSPRSPNVLGLIQGNLLYGFSVSLAGDLNCDGLSDVIVGEPGGTSLGIGTGLLGLVSTNAVSGKAYVYYGRSGGPMNSPSYIVQETGALSVANLLGTSVSDAGDVNHDGRSDFLIGAPNGTMNFATTLTGLVGSALNIITENSVGSAYSYFGCLTNTDLDFDNDGIPDAIDLDDDNDGTPDISEYPGLALTQDPADDADGDGIPNYMDSDFTGCGGLNGAGICSAFDKDGDGVPNSFDLDSDNDGIPDVIESGGVDVDGDGVLDNFTDTDNDGLGQTVDANNTGASGSGTGLGAPDFDGDGIPNAYDLDSDGDGISDLREAGLPDVDNNALVDAFADSDGDGYTNALDAKEGHSGPADPAGIGVPALITPTDTNNDGHYNGNPTVGNLDLDARYNFLDLDADNDGITDNVEAQSTIGYVLPTATDTDGDGIADIYDSQGGVYGAGGITPYNYEGAGNPDYLDTDSDNDLLPDVIEGHDYNGNGIPDDDVTLTGVDTDGDGIDDKFDLVAGPNATTQGIGNPPIPGSRGPLQTTNGGPDRDFRNALLILPLKLISFTAAQNGSTVQLRWITANEENVSHFEIERSANGRSFSSIGTVSANNASRYAFIDQQPFSDNNYYRLKIVDNDSRFSYSNVLLLSTSGALTGIRVYPNPVKDQLQLVWNQMPKGDYNVEVINSTGQVIKQYGMEITGTNQVTQLSRENNWKPGIYMIRVTNATSKSIVTQKVIIQ